jgi:DNA-directed RNA polymerase II subunit RPB2
MKAPSDIQKQWAALRIRYRCEGPAKHHVDSYDEALRVTIPKAFTEEPVECFVDTEAKRFNKQEAGMRVIFNRVHYGLPTDSNNTIMLPIDARNRQSSYAHPMYFDLTVQTLDADRQIISSVDHACVSAGYIPTLVRSKFCSTQQVPSKNAVEQRECMYDLPYFIVNDVEKIFIAQEDMIQNRAVIQQKRVNNRISYQAQVTSKHPSILKSTSTLYVRVCQQPGLRHVVNWVVRIRLPFIKLDVPIVQFFRAVGVETDKEIIDLMFYNYEVSGSVESIIRNCFADTPIQTCEVARNSILARCQSNWRVIMRDDVLPDMGDDLAAKKMAISGICRRLVLMAARLRAPDDRDHMMFKRIRSTGDMFSYLFRSQLVKRIRNELKQSMEKTLTTGKTWDINTAVNTMAMFKGVKYCIATGNLTAGKSVQQKILTGVTQMVQRLSLLSALSQSRRVNSSMQREGRQSAPREQHSTHTGRYCPSDTPEGQPVGLVHNLAVSQTVSVECNIRPVLLHILQKHGQAVSYTPRSYWGKYDFLLNLNGYPVTVLTKMAAVVNELRLYRRLGLIPRDVSVAVNVMDREVNVQTDGGRQLALKVHADATKQVWDVLNETNVTFVEMAKHLAFLDPEEEETCLIAVDRKNLESSMGPNRFTHAEIHFSANLGISTLTNPYPDHNQAPRNTYADAMGKQGMGVPQINFESIFPTSLNVLDYPQKPVVSSQQSQLMGMEDMPSGQMFIVAVMCDGDHTIEDAIQINKRSVEFGLGNCHVYKSVDTTEMREFEAFEKPTPENCIQMKRASHDHIGDDGMPKIGSHITDKDVIIGKTLNLSTKKNGAADNGVNALRKDTSVTPKNADGGIVHSVYKGKTVSGDRLAKVMLRQPRVPICGSKFSTRHGMKGTISMMFNPEDAPFNKDGISPDIIMNPHGKPSRMSWGEMFESMMSMLGIMKGFQWDATPFSEQDHTVFIEGVRDELRKMGIDGNCTEMLYSGRTGLPIGRVFMGPIFAQRLKHMVEDKIWQRWRGPKQMLTKAPTEGRVRKGGFKIGEMEQAALLSQGVTEFLRDRLFVQCDYSRLPVCRQCGMIAVVNKQHDFSICTLCNTRGTVGIIEIPYGTKMLFQMLTSMNCCPKIHIKPISGDKI